jgi:hypothetical protein
MVIRNIIKTRFVNNLSKKAKYTPINTANKISRLNMNLFEKEARMYMYKIKNITKGVKKLTRFLNVEYTTLVNARNERGILKK